MWNPESHSKPLECVPSFRAEPQLPLKHCLFCPAISSYLFSHILSEPKAWNALISQCMNVSIPFSNLASLPRTFSSSISFQDGRTASLHNSIPDVNGHCPILSGLFFMLTAACWESALARSYLRCTAEKQVGLLFLRALKYCWENTTKVSKCRKCFNQAAIVTW